MLDYSEIEREIDNLEHGKTTYNNIEKLALLYVVRDNMNSGEKRIKPYSYADAPAESEFIEAAKTVDFDALLTVLDEHMTAVKAIYPREYAAVIRKIRALT